jgi:RNA polymerase sigma factor (sigma-70 family)
MRIDEFEGVTIAQLNALEKVLDQVFAKLGIDVEFTRHFLDRVNDERNIKQITIKELGNLFAKEFRKWGKPIAQMGPDAEAVMKDLSSDINLPFALNWNKQSGMLELVAKTVMRKKNFRTPNKEFPVESLEQVDESLIADLVAQTGQSPAEIWTTLTLMASAAGGSLVVAAMMLSMHIEDIIRDRKKWKDWKTRITTEIENNPEWAKREAEKAKNNPSIIKKAKSILSFFKKQKATEGKDFPVEAAYPAQQMSRYNPDGETYRGTTNRIPNSKSVSKSDITVKRKKADFPDGATDDTTFGDFAKKELKQTALDVISTLNKREQLILKARFGFEPFNKSYTIQQVASAMDLSPERIRQIEAKALRKLKHPRSSRKLRSYMDENGLPPHLAKHFDKDGDAVKGSWKDGEWKADKKQPKKVKYTVKDVTPKGYGPVEEAKDWTDNRNWPIGLMVKHPKPEITQWYKWDGQQWVSKSAGYPVSELDPEIEPYLDKAGAYEAERLKGMPGESVNEDFGGIPPLTDLIVMAVVGQTTVAALKAAYKTGKYALKLKKLADRAGVKINNAVMGESNPFTDARMNAIKAGKKEFTVNGKTYRVTGDTTDEEEAIANEAINRDEYAAKLATQQKDKFFAAALAALDRLVKSDPRGQDVGGYAFDIARAFEGINGRELARVYDETK